MENANQVMFTSLEDEELRIRSKYKISSFTLLSPDGYSSKKYYFVVGSSFEEFIDGPERTCAALNGGNVDFEIYADSVWTTAYEADSFATPDEIIESKVYLTREPGR